MSDIKALTQRLRDVLPLSKVVSSFLPLKRKGRDFWGLCPFHQEKGASFKVDDDKGFYHCFGCGAHGDLISFVMEKTRVGFLEAVEQLAAQAQLSMPQKISSSGGKDAALYRILEEAGHWFSQQLASSAPVSLKDYLKKRHLDPELIQRFRLGYAPPQGGLLPVLRKKGFSLEEIQKAGLIGQSREENSQSEPVYEWFRDRLIFPILDGRDKIIGFGGRSLSAERKPKYLNSPETPCFQKSHTLYGISHAKEELRHRKKDETSFVLVGEGYMDALQLIHHGFPAVAPLGTALTVLQLEKLWTLNSTVILCFDGDEAGNHATQRAVHKALPLLSGERILKICLLPSGQDPDSFLKTYGVNTFHTYVKEALSLIDFLWQREIYSHASGTPEEKAKALKRILELTEDMKDRDLRYFYRNDLKKRLFAQSKQQGVKRFFLQGPLPPILRHEKKREGLKILLATLINHPQIIEEVSEELSKIEDMDAALTGLKEEILLNCQKFITHTEEMIIECLQSYGFGTILDEVLCEKVYLKARFSRPSSSTEDALKGWKEMWEGLMNQDALTDQISQEITEISHSLSPQKWNQLKHLKKMLITRGKTD